MVYKVFAALFAFLLPILLLVDATPGRADTGWLSTVNSCEEFQIGVTKFYSELGELTNLSADQTHELDQVLDAACSDKFSRCQFTICRGPTAWRSSVARTGEPAVIPPAPIEPEAIPTVVANVPEPIGTVEPVPIPPLPEPMEELPPPAKSATPGANATPPPASEEPDEIVVDVPSSERKIAIAPLPEDVNTPVEIATPVKPVEVASPSDFPWLSPKLSCKELLEEVKKRYRPYDRNSEVGKKQRDELKRVLKVICSPAFQRCSFAACRSVE